MKYVVSVKEISYGSVVVEAKNPQEAKTAAEEQYHKGNVFWNDSEFDVSSVKREQDRGDAR